MSDLRATLEPPAAATAPPAAPTPPGAIYPSQGPRATRFAVTWGAGWAAVGALVAAGIVFALRPPGVRPLVLTSVLFAEVVGFTALLSVRVAFPFFVRLALPVRLAVQVLTLVAGTVFGSAAILLAQPLYLLANLRLVAMIVLINAVLATLVGFALHTYDAMRRQIEASYEAIRQKEALDREIQIARDVQRQLLPREVPKVVGLDLAGLCIPAIGVGGDYFDYIAWSDERLGLVIADVSGKGISAALLMAGLQASVRSLAHPGSRPSEVARKVNDTLHRSVSAARYATFFFGLYDPASRVLTYSNAGHHPPLHLGAGGVARLASGGIPIGLFPETSYGEGLRELHPGDLLALYTDGVVEAPDAAGREFGTERLIEVLGENRHRSLPEILDAVVAEVERWQGTGRPHDDVTLVLARAR